MEKLANKSVKELNEIREQDRKSVVQGKSVDLGGRWIIKKKKKEKKKKKKKKKKESGKWQIVSHQM